MLSITFDELFRAATRSQAGPYEYQRHLASKRIQSCLIDVPTGCGKTAAAILGWLWQRIANRDTTPRRLVYCLPMRVLVEQTFDNAQAWLRNLAMDNTVRVHKLMGGEATDEWDLYPEQDAILIGTQDMLLSRALNRGYGMSRYRWPMHFGLLHTDCLWIFDEVQLMGTGLATTAQLHGFRLSLQQNGCHCFWMSATLQRDWLRTVDFDPAHLPVVKLEEDDRTKEGMRQIITASKPLQRARAPMGDPKGLAEDIVSAHVEAQKKANGLTLVVVNTVERAKQLHDAVQRKLNDKGLAPEPVLIHSRFRPPERERQIKRLREGPGGQGMIVISTQVVEAGVDVSARTLFTELAPWSSMVQRFGRCNRRGLENDAAQVFWLDLPSEEGKRDKLAAPYEPDELNESRGLLMDCDDVSPVSLESRRYQQPFRHTWVIRRKDFLELFDTTPDLAGNDIDVERYVREIEECDVQVFWRDWTGERPPTDMGRARREELCSVPVGQFRQFIQDDKRRNRVFRWDHLDRQWERVDPDRVYAGQIYLLHSAAGGYAPSSGWDIKLTDKVEPIPGSSPPPEANDDEPLSETTWQSIAEHTDEVCRKLESILAKVSLPDFQATALRLAAHWHDRGKAHCIFQKKVRETAQGESRPAAWLGRSDIAKAPREWWRRDYERKRFRHELASALAVLISLPGEDAKIRDLVAYLVAAHHGKVRLSIRSLPEERMPPDGRRFARGIWDGDALPETQLGSGVTAPAVVLSLEPMELGLCEQPPLTGQPSWTERMLALRDEIGPCRLAYLEAILRAADARASKTPNLLEVSRA